jgi:hypothetical protein
LHHCFVSSERINILQHDDLNGPEGNVPPQETGKDPITQEPLELDDLVPVKTNKAVKPRPSPATSIPGLLGLFHNVRYPSGFPL